MLKKLLFVGAFLMGLTSFGQEVKFGIQAGYTSMEAKSSNSIDDVSYSGSSSGVYFGALLDLPLSENFNLQPSVNYATADDTNFLIVPLIAQYHIEQSGFYFLAGPQATFMLDKISVMGVDMLNTFGLDLAFGAGYEIDSNFFLEAKYSFELTNRYSKEIKDAANSQGADVDAGFNAFSIGVGYKF